MYESFDKNSVWVMQTWSMRKHIVKAVPKNRLLLLDINSEKTKQCRNVWGYPVVAGMLHNFGGKNSMQGKLRSHCENVYLKLKKRRSKCCRLRYVYGGDIAEPRYIRFAV